MSRTPRLSNTDIEYLDKVWNFTSGCGKGCTYCYAKKITKRFTNHYPNGFEPTLYPEALLSPLHIKKPSRIGVCFMGDLFTDCPEFDPNRTIGRENLFPDGVIPAEAVGIGLPPFNKLSDVVKAVIRACPQHTLFFLTKQPQNLPKWSPFPSNCYVGVTVTNPELLIPALDALDSIQCGKRYLSIEPMLGRFNIPDLDILLGGTINQVIIGSQTKPYKPPKIEWVREIVEACDKAGIPVFLKGNLKKALPFNDAEWAWERHKWAEGKTTQPMYTGLLRQEMPKLDKEL